MHSPSFSLLGRKAFKNLFTDLFSDKLANEVRPAEVHAAVNSGHCLFLLELSEAAVRPDDPTQRPRAHREVERPRSEQTLQYGRAGGANTAMRARVFRMHGFIQ